MNRLLVASALLFTLASSAWANSPAIPILEPMAQSAAPTAAPLPWIGCVGAYADAQGRLWTVSGDRAYCFVRDASGRWSCPADGIVPLPYGMKKMKGFEGRLICVGHDDKLYALDLATRKAKLLVEPRFSDGKGLRDFTVGKAGVYILGQNNMVRAYAHDGTLQGDLFTVPLPPGKIDWWYCAIGIEPTGGDILVGSYWPDTKVYRFTVAGKAVVSDPPNDEWPRSGQADALYDAAGATWVLGPGGDSRALGPVTGRAPKALAGEAWGYYPTGLAILPSGEAWLACAQGLLGFDRKGRPTGQRLGGLGDPSLVAAADGTVLVLVENSQRFIRLSADDDPSTAFASNANEPWRVANGWGGKAVGCAWDGKGYLVLDAGASKALWRFDPAHTAFAESPWVRLGKEKAFTDPRALAVGDGCCWVLDGAALLELGPGAWEAAPRPVPLPAAIDLKAVVAMCAVGDDRLYLATKSEVVALDRKQGAWIIAWRWNDATGSLGVIAATRERVFVAERPQGQNGAGEVTSLDARDGHLVTAIAPADEARTHFDPTGISVAAGWAFIADAGMHRLLRTPVR